METKMIYDMEESNRTQVVLHKEGIFWRAYQRSAYFVTRELKKCAVLRKFVKKINADLVYLGFPDAGLADFLEQVEKQGFVVEERGEKQIVLGGFEGGEGYEAWFNSVTPTPSAVRESAKPLPTPGNCSGCPFQEIVNWQLASLTPMEVMVKLSEFQRQRRYGL